MNAGKPDLGRVLRVRKRARKCLAIPSHVLMPVGRAWCGHGLGIKAVFRNDAGTTGIGGCLRTRAAGGQVMGRWKGAERAERTIQLFCITSSAGRGVEFAVDDSFPWRCNARIPRTGALNPRMPCCGVRGYGRREAAGERNRASSFRAAK